MSTSKNINFIKIISLTLLIFLMVFVYILFETNRITPYGLINWFISYKDGFSRRCFLSSVYFSIKYFSNNNEYSLSFIPNIHKFFVFVLFSAIFYIVYKSKNFTFIACTAFLLVASPAIKNAIFLTGYTDIYLLFTILLAIIFRSKNYFVATFLCILISGLIHELSFFLYLPLILIDLYLTFKVDRTNFISLLLTYIFGLTSIILVFLCNFDTNELIRLLNQNIKQEATLNTIKVLLNEHYSFVKLFIKRFSNLFENYQNTIFAFLLLSWQGLLCSYLFICKNTTIETSKKFIISLLALTPCTVVFLATDIWRFLSLYTFSIFTIIVLLDCRFRHLFQPQNKNKKNILISITFFISLFSICIPYQMLTTERFGYNGIPNEAYKKLLGNTIFVDYAYKINLFYNYWNGLFDNYTSNIHRTCFKDGNKAIQLTLSPGLKNITIHSNPNNNTTNSITLGKYQIILNGKKEVSFNFYSEESVVNKGAYIFYCNPTDNDWYIDKIEVKSIEK